MVEWRRGGPVVWQGGNLQDQEIRQVLLLILKPPIPLVPNAQAAGGKPTLCVWSAMCWAGSATCWVPKGTRAVVGFWVLKHSLHIDCIVRQNDFHPIAQVKFRPWSDRKQHGSMWSSKWPPMLGVYISLPLTIVSTDTNAESYYYVYSHQWWGLWLCPLTAMLGLNIVYTDTNAGDYYNGDSHQCWQLLLQPLTPMLGALIVATDPNAGVTITATDISAGGYSYWHWHQFWGLILPPLIPMIGFICIAYQCVCGTLGKK